MIGFYDYTVVLTFLSLISSIVGMTQAMEGRFRMAIIFLAISGLLDTFDGKVARTKKNRSDDQKLYGIQLDSLVDVVCFGIFPIMVCYLMGLWKPWDLAIFCFYGICGVIRLSYFNVLETNRQMHPNGEEKVYHGLPITSIAVILPLTFLLSFVVNPDIFTIILRVVMFLTGLLFIVDFKLQKPKNWQLGVLIFVVGCAVLAVWLFSGYRVVHHPEPEEPLVDTSIISCAELEPE